MSLDVLSNLLLMHVIAPMILESGVVDEATKTPVADLNLDDTTAARYGKYVAHAGWFKDASATGPATKETAIHWAHNGSVRDPSGRQKDDFFFCTDAETPDEEIVQRYYDRWGVEECIQEAKQCLGFETTRGWCSRTVHRQAPLAMVLVTLVKAWYARCAPETPSLQPQAQPWNPHKARPSFADMLSGLRCVLWKHRILANSGF